MPSLVLLNILAAVTLLLWGLRHLKNGMMKGFGMQIRTILSIGTKNRFSAVLTGIFVTLLVQSSTAAILIVSAFVSQGFVGLSAGIALALGADLGTALVATLLSLDLSWLMPSLLIIGFILYGFKNHSRVHNLGRVFSGLGLMLLSLHWIKDVAAPLAQSDVLPVVLLPLVNDPVFAIFMAAGLTWLAHSSLAMILLFMSLCVAGVINPMFGFYLVLGANLGGTMPSIIATWRDRPAAANIPLANAIIRLTGVLVIFPFVPLVAEYLFAYIEEGPHALISFHLAFNIALCVFALPLTGVIANVTMMIRPHNLDPDDPATPRYLNNKHMNSPAIALGDAARETLRMAELLEDMLGNTIKAFKTDNRNFVEKVREEDHTIDRLYASIKIFIAQLLSHEELDKKQAERAVHILTFATNLEHAGDVIDKNLMAMADKKIKYHNRFSDKGFEEISAYHARVLESVSQAQQLFMTNDKDLAEIMIADKRGFMREAEEAATLAHIARLKDGIPETMATSSLHLDIIRDLRRINTYMCAVAYNVLNKSAAQEPAAEPIEERVL